jgi:asparagine synthase (glutamine-hydrolysing)
MCGILGFFGNSDTSCECFDRKHFLELSRRIRHRGPDWSGLWQHQESKVTICHERLSIVGVDSGSQPIDNKELGIVLSVNGEIYNYQELYDVVLYNKYTPQTKSDCEVIIYLYHEFGAECVKMLDGIFGFILYDYKNGNVLIARDPVGIIPLYYGLSENNEVYVCSEMKSIHDQCRVTENKNLVDIDVFPPASYFHSNVGSISQLGESNFNTYFVKSWEMDNLTIADCSVDLNELNSNTPVYNLMELLRDRLTHAVRKRLMADVPYGVLLSGGLDSSLICSITSKICKEEQSKNKNWGNRLHTFSIGLKDAPDLKYARKVAEFCNTVHHEYNFTVQEGIDAIPDLIHHLETYDITTIRASTPMYLMSRLIKSLGIKMVLSGEGADEILGGYLYFHNAPNAKEFHNECVSRVNALSHFDCLRANKSTMAWGLEARVPFLDRSFLQAAMPINPTLKLLKEEKREKYILRKAFSEDVCGEAYLPDDILWRQKEQFSDGVGYNWIDGLKGFIDTQISGEEFESAISTMKKNKEKDIPKTREALYYRQIFDELFPNRSNIVPRWIPRTDWDGVSYDPSGRAQKVHNQAL